MARFLIMEYTKINAETIDKWIEEGWEWGIPISHEAFLEAKKGNWEVGLTPTKAVPKEWFGDLKGKKILGFFSQWYAKKCIFEIQDCKPLGTGWDFSQDYIGIGYCGMEGD